MTQALPSSLSSAASIPRPLTPLEQAVRDADPSSTHFEPNLLALIDGYAYDDHKQVAADKTKLTAELQGRLVTRLNNEAYAFSPGAIFDIIEATAIGEETPLLLACKAALIRGVTSDTGREARQVTELTEFHARKAEAFTREESAYGPSVSPFSLFIFRDIARSTKQLELRRILFSLHNDTMSIADTFHFDTATHAFRMDLEEISDSIIQFSIVDPTGASTLRQNLAARVQVIYDTQKTTAHSVMNDASNSVLVSLESGAAHTSIADRFDLRLRTTKWGQLNSIRYNILCAIHEALMKSAHVPRYRSAGHTLSKDEMTPILERIEKKMEAIIDGLKQPSPDFDSLIAAVTGLAKDTREIRVNLPELPFNDAFEVRERFYQLFRDFYSAQFSDRALSAIMVNLLDSAAVKCKEAIAAVRNQGAPATAAQHTEITNTTAALKQLADKLLDLNNAVKLL